MVDRPKVVPLFSGVEKNASIKQKTIAVLQNTGKNVSNASKFLVEETKVIGTLVQKAADDPEVEKITQTIVVPATAALSVATIAPSLASILIPLLRFLFLQPLLLFGRKKREEWGQIYNTLTKLPVDLAMVRLVDSATKRIV